MLKINETAPNFKANSTIGEIEFHQWLGDSWAILFSHPKDFTPVCTTELGYMASIEKDFTKRNCKLIGLSIDSVEDHNLWKKDIEDVQGTSVNYPLIADENLKIAKLEYQQSEKDVIIARSDLSPSATLSYEASQSEDASSLYD